MTKKAMTKKAMKKKATKKKEDGKRFINGLKQALAMPKRRMKPHVMVVQFLAHPTTPAIERIREGISVGLWESGGCYVPNVENFLAREVTKTMSVAQLFQNVDDAADAEAHR
jgi:hypothetical protein